METLTVLYTKKTRGCSVLARVAQLGNLDFIVELRVTPSADNLLARNPMTMAVSMRLLWIANMGNSQIRLKPYVLQR
jgi:hypothetical protein